MCPALSCKITSTVLTDLLQGKTPCYLMSNLQHMPIIRPQKTRNVMHDSFRICLRYSYAAFSHFLELSSPWSLNVIHFNEKSSTSSELHLMCSMKKERHGFRATQIKCMMIHLAMLKQLFTHCLVFFCGIIQG